MIQSTMVCPAVLARLIVAACVVYPIVTDYDACGCPHEAPDLGYPSHEEIEAEQAVIREQEAEARALQEAARAFEAFHDVAPGVRATTIERVYDDSARARIVVVRVLLDATALDVVPVPDRRFERAFAGPDVSFAINGGFFEPDFAPSGLVVSRGVVLSRARPRGGSGILVIEGGIARLVSAEGADVSHATFAIQSGPRLIEPGGVLGINADAPARARRSAVCIRDEGRMLDFIVAERVDGPDGPGLHALARWLVAGIPFGEPGCDAALNLDGGPSTALDLRDDPQRFVRPHGPVVHALTVRERDHARARAPRSSSTPSSMAPTRP
jgi:uncharacterized protein YigE (DUF2233 family)